MAISIHFTAEHQRLLRELLASNLLVQVLNEASDSEVQIDIDVTDSDGELLQAVFEQNDMPVEVAGDGSMF